jgi:multidrug resistance efflux pump
MKKTSSRSSSFSFRPHILPVTVWLAVVMCIVWLFSYRASRFEVLGIAQEQLRQIAANCPGRLRAVSVGLFDQVKMGQTLAVVDTVLDNENLPEIVQAQLATISAETERLQAELVTTENRLSADAVNMDNNRIADQRRFNVDVENARLRILQLQLTIETDRLSLEGLELNSKIFVLQNRPDVSDSASYELKKLKLQYDTLAKRIQENERLLEEAKRDLQQAQQRREEFAQRQPQHPSVENALEVIRKAIQVQEHRMQELTVQRSPLELKSPFNGVVSLIQRRPGETVRAGDPILTVAEVNPTVVIAYANERQASQIQERMEVELVKKSERLQIARSQVASVSPTIEQLPARLWRNPNIPQWGRAVVVKSPPGLQLLPGEIVGVRGL